MSDTIKSNRSQPDADVSRAILQSKLPLGDGKLHSTNLTSPTLTGPLKSCPTGLNNVHEAYWNALQAHQQAVSKYTSLKSELETLSARHVSSTTDANPDGQLFADRYVPLLHQREVLRRLQVIEKAYSSLSKDSSSPAAVPFDEFVKQRAGEMPLLPSTRNQSDDRNTAAADRTFELKKAVLLAKKTVDDHFEANAEHNANGEAKHEPEAQIYALQQARNELIAWIEDKLSLIGKAQAENARPVEALAVTGDEAPIPVSKSEIGQIYDQYIATRKSLLRAIQQPNTSPLEHHSDISDDYRTPSAGRKQDEAGSLACSLLPYLAHLAACKEHDQVNLQHAAFNMQQLEKSETITAQLLRRLADESHLVHPGADRGKDWSEASNASMKLVADDVLGRVHEGTKGLQEADGTIRRLTDLPTMLRPDDEGDR